MSFSRLVAALSSVSEAKIRDTPTLQGIDQLTGRLRECEGKRNIILHSIYSEMDEGVVRIKITVKQKEGLWKIFYQVGPEMIDETTTYIEDTRKRLVQLARELKSHKILANEFFQDLTHFQQITLESRAWRRFNRT